MLRMRLKTGDIVVRSIEGMGFEAKVLAVNQNDRELVLEYLDDGNIEKGVSFDDIQEIINAKDSSSSSRPHSKIDTLAKPLLGLVEDDYEARRNHQPKVFIHENVDEEESKSAIILNGAENKLAAGGGLRALRYLKK